MQLYHSYKKRKDLYLSVSYDYGLIESYIYFTVTVLVKSHVYSYKHDFLLFTIQLYLKKFEIYEVVDFIFTRKNLDLLEDYIRI